MIGASDLRRRPRCQASVHRYAPAGRSVIADAGDAARRADQPCAPEPVIAEAPPAAQNWAGTRGFGPGSVTYCEVPRRCKAGSRRGIPTPRLRPWLAAGGAARPCPLPRPPTILEAVPRPIRGIQDQQFGGWAHASYQRAWSGVQRPRTRVTSTRSGHLRQAPKLRPSRNVARQSMRQIGHSASAAAAECRQLWRT